MKRSYEFAHNPQIAEAEVGSPLHCALTILFINVNPTSKIHGSREFIPLSIIMFRNTEVRHKRVYGCRKKRFNTGTFF
jgi:hypothetical protein